MGKIIAIANQKGGVGKTTTSQALISGLTNKGFRTLGIDFDPQANLSFSMGADFEDSPTIYNVLKEQIKITDVIQTTKSGKIVPSNILLSGAELEFNALTIGREFILKDVLDTIKDEFEFIIIDCPPSLGILTVNVFTTADELIIPVESEAFSLQGLGKLNDTIKLVQKIANKNLKILGIIVVNHNERTNLGSQLRSVFVGQSNNIETRVFNTYIRPSISVREAQLEQKSIFDYDIKSNAAVDYLKFIDEMLEKIN